MKKLTREELLEDALRLMKAHGKTKVFATQDGNYFFDHNGAMFHNNDMKTQNREWNGEIIPFEDAPAEQAAAVDEPVKHKVTAEDLENNPDLVEMGIKEGDEIVLPTEAEIEAFKKEKKKLALKEEGKAVKDADKALREAAGALSKADKKLEKAPEDETAIGEAAAAKDAHAKAQLELDNAKTRLAALQA